MLGRGGGEEPRKCSRCVFTSQKLMVKKLELTLRNIDEKCFNIKKNKIKIYFMNKSQY